MDIWWHFMGVLYSFMLVEQINRCVALSICVIIIKESWGWCRASCWWSRSTGALRCVIIIKESWGWCRASCFKRLPVSELLPAQLSKPNWAGMCYRGVRRETDERGLTCGCYMEEMDKHVLRKGYGIWVGKIVFLIFRICFNNSIYTLW